MLSVEQLDAKLKRLEKALSKCLNDQERLRVRHAINNVLTVKNLLLSGRLDGV